MKLTLGGTILLSLASIFPIVSRAQQSPPLQGQGQDPFNAGLVNSPVPVYVSVELLKLLSIDEQAYQFQALFMVQQSWTDNRTDSVFSMIEEGDKQSQGLLDRSLAKCSPNASVTPNLTSPDCIDALTQPPQCNKYCSTYGTNTDTPWRCCDRVWLPGLSLRNQIDTSQDRIVSDQISSFNYYYTGYGASGVVRKTMVNARFSSVLQFQDYPFDSQNLNIFVDTALPTPDNSSGFYVVPSGAFRRLNQKFDIGPNRTAEVVGLGKNELAGWSIKSFTFSCTNETGAESQKKRNSLSEQTQAFDPRDPYNNYYMYYEGNKVDPNNVLRQTCALNIAVSRLSSTAVVGSLLPVAFIGLLSFVIYFTDPDEVDLRVGTLVTLFLALTAVQFVFAGVLPLASYLTDFDIFILISYCTIMASVIDSLAVYLIATSLRHSQRAGQVGPEHHKLAEDQGEKQKGRAVAGEGPSGTLHSPEAQGLSGQGQGPWNEAADAPDEEASSGQRGRKESPGRNSRGLPGLLTRVGIFRRGGRPQGSHGLIKDETSAYVLACRIDMAVGILLFLLYAILSAVNFTAGLR